MIFTLSQLGIIYYGGYLCVECSNLMGKILNQGIVPKATKPFEEDDT